MKVKIPYKLFPIANSYEHWQSRMKRVRQEYLIVNSFLKELPPLPVVVKLTRIAPRSWDSDNNTIAFKNIRDAIAKKYFPKSRNGMMDSYRGFEWQYYQTRGEPKEYAIEIEIVEKC